MLIKTHLAISLAAILIFISVVEYKITFVMVVLISTLIPDIDTKNSKMGDHLILRPFQLFVKHRSIFHSFSFLLLVTLFFVLFLPVLSLGFFLGYGLHLFADSFTKEGIQVFYPWKRKSNGWITTGGKTEVSVFVFFIILDLFLIFIRISGLF